MVRPDIDAEGIVDAVVWVVWVACVACVVTLRRPRIRHTDPVQPESGQYGSVRETVHGVITSSFDPLDPALPQHRDHPHVE